MFANRFTALMDACALVPALHRNLLLTLAEAEFFRIRWSARILDEVERSVARLLAARGPPDAAARAARARRAMEHAFPEAAVTGHESLVPALTGLPDPDDAHVIAAALRGGAVVIVTENIRHFPPAVLAPLDLEAKTVDDFAADAIDLDTERAVAALRRMRERLKAPERTAGTLLLSMEAAGLTLTTAALRAHMAAL